MRTSFPGRVRVVLPIVPECAAPDRINDDEEDQEDDVDGGDLLPVVLQVGKHACLAGHAVVAEHGLVVRPCGAVGVISCSVEARGLDPDSLALVGKVTTCWWLAASRLDIR